MSKYRQLCEELFEHTQLLFFLMQVLPHVCQYTNIHHKILRFYLLSLPKISLCNLPTIIVDEKCQR